MSVCSATASRHQAVLISNLISVGAKRVFVSVLTVRYLVQVKDDSSAGDLLVKHPQKDEATVSATDGYKNRVSIAENSSLLIAQGSLADQRIFTCMVVSLTNLKEYSVEVKVYSKYAQNALNKCK